MNIWRKTLNNKAGKIRLIVLLIGVLEFILPLVNTEDDILYVFSPWIYIGCFLYFTRTIKRKREWVFFGIVFLTACELRYVGFLGDTEDILTAVSILLIIILATATIIPFFVDRFYQKKGHGILRLVAFPLTRILMERLIIGKQFNLSLTQFGNKALIQSTAFLGDVFITFVVAFIPSIIVYMIIEKDDKKLRKTGICVLSAFLMMLVLGTVRYLKSKRPENDILMAYASGPQKTYYEDPSDTEAGYSENVEYLRKSVKAAAENEAKLIAYAEEAFIVNKTESENLVSKAKELAKEYNIYILLCLDIDDDENCYNKALLIDKSGQILSDYIKTNLIPVVEDDYTEGDGEIPCNEIEIDGQKINVSYTICYDATFSDYLMSMDDRTDLYINPSWDWDEIDDLNYRMQGMSAVMAGVELFKPTVDGWSVVSDPYGNVSYKESTLGINYNEVFFAPVTPDKTKTLYKSIYKYVRAFWTIAVGMLVADFFYLLIVLFLDYKKNRK